MAARDDDNGDMGARESNTGSNTGADSASAVDELLLAGDGAYLVGVAVQLRSAGQIKAAGRVLAISAALLAMPADSWSEARRFFG